MLGPSLCLAFLVWAPRLQATNSAPRFYEERLHNACAASERHDMAEACGATCEAAEILELSAQVDTMLSMWLQESHFKVAAEGDDGHSLGIAQTRLRSLRKIRALWRARGYKLPAFRGNPRTQAFFGVMEFSRHLHWARGDVFEAVRRYNGSGLRAAHYASDVMATRARLFARPYVPGEKQAYR